MSTIVEHVGSGAFFAFGNTETTSLHSPLAVSRPHNLSSPFTMPSLVISLIAGS